MIEVTRAAVEEALERELDDEEFAKLPGRLRKASQIVEGYLGIEYDPDDADNPPPQAAIDVVAAAAARVYDVSDNNVPAYTDSKTQGMGPFNATTRFNTDATSGRTPWLTKADKLRLRNVFSGMRAVGSRSDRC